MKPFSQITTQFTESVIREMTRVSHAKGGINLAQGFPDLRIIEGQTNCFKKRSEKLFAFSKTFEEYFQTIFFRRQ